MSSLRLSTILVLRTPCGVRMDGHADEDGNAAPSGFMPAQDCHQRREKAGDLRGMESRFIDGARYQPVLRVRVF